MDKKDIVFQLIEDGNQALFCVNEEGSVEYCNKRALETLEAESIEKVKDFLHPDDHADYDELVKVLKEKPGTFKKSNFRFISKSGDLVPLATNSVYNEKSKFIYSYGFLQGDLTVDKNLYNDAKRIAKVGIWEYDVQSGLLTWDDDLYSIYELNSDTEISLKRMKQFFRKESLVIFEEKLKELIDTGVGFEAELAFISGKFRPSTGRFTAKAMDKTAQKVSGTVQDLTDVKSIERKAEDYQEAVDKSSIVSITDRYGVITEVNDRFCEITQYAKEDLIGKTHQLINSEFHPKEFWTEMWETIGVGDVWRGEIQNKAKDGSRFWVDTTIIPFKNSIGRIYQYLAIQRDFTENKKLNEELMVSEKLSSIGEISAQILHEVMTPLSIIALSIENLEDDVDELEDDQAQKKAMITNIHEIKMNYERIEDIFNNMRSILVRKNAGLAMDIEIKDIIQKTLTLVNAKLKSKDITVNIDKIPEGLTVNSTSSDLSQIFLNLINNSCDAIDSLNEKWINLKAEVSQGDVIITFQDSGKGIPQEIQSRIFETLFTTKGDSTGTGLGMGVCKKLIERHQGTIEIDNSAPHTTFKITFPFVKK